MKRLALVILCGAAAVAALRAQQPKLGYDDTPMQPNGNKITKKNIEVFKKGIGNKLN